MKGGDIPPKTTGTTGTGTIRLLFFTSKKQYINEIRYYKTDST